MGKLDIIIPVYHEQDNIIPVLQHLVDEVRTPFRVLLCYDLEEDPTLEVLRAHPEVAAAAGVELVKNPGRGAHRAVMAGFARSTAGAVLVFPADDTTNAGRLDEMVALLDDGCEIVTACRFMPGGCMRGCPWLKAILVRTAALVLHRFAGVPSRDPTNGFRLFSRRVLEKIAVESKQGFTYSIELLVKAHRRGWKIGEVPVKWFERRSGRSRFRVLRWLPAYLRWVAYAFATIFTKREGEAIAK